MNATDQTNNIASPRRRGAVRGFGAAGREYLEAVRADLGLSVTPDEFSAACGILRMLRRDPTADELYFVSEYICASKKMPSALRVKEVRSDDKALLTIFGDIAGLCIDRQKSSDAGITSPCPVPLVQFARTAAGVRDSEFTVSISPELSPTVPMCASPSAIAASGGFRIAVSRKRLSARFSAREGDLLILLAPAEGCAADDFAARISHAAAALESAAVSTAFYPVSGNGLIFDISAFCRGGRLNAPMLPGAPDHADAFCHAFCGTVLAAIRPEAFDRAGKIFEDSGIRAFPFGDVFGDSFLISSANSESRTLETMVNLPSDLLWRLRFYRDASMTAISAPIPGSADANIIANPCSDAHRTECGKIAFFPEAQLLISAARAAGPDPVSAIRAAFETAARSIVERGAPTDAIRYAVCGSLAADDSSAIPLIAGLDAYVRNREPFVTAAHFGLCSFDSAITVFAFASAGTKKKYS
ncbi:MAG: hypothetical protein ACI3XO_02340 [Eubacteriales bacterium]